MAAATGGREAACLGAESTFTQKPEVAPSQVKGDKPEPAAPVAAAEPEKDRGPAPVWIWGARPERRYFLRVEFEGGGRDARIKATCDNRMTLFLNGRRVTSSNTWQLPVVADLRNRVQPGKNELLAEVENDGGVAGFALRLEMTMPDGSKRYVVSDGSWRAAEGRDTQQWAPVKTLGTMGVGPWKDVFARSLGQSGGSPRETFQLLPGYQVERLFTVPRETLGSWVSITVDNKGRLIASDQGNQGLCRITPPPVGSKEPTRVERLKVKISAAQGLLYAFDSLYVSVNGGPGSGLDRGRDTDGDDQFDQVDKLLGLRGGGEHGPHSLRLTPDGKSILLVCGNHTKPPEQIDASRLPTNWGEDQLLPRQWDANGHARGILAPGGWIARTDPNGETWEIVSSGYRNAFDMDHNADGELFAYDSDMEWDFGMPWYRPTRVTHATSGSEFGWRSGTGKWPPYYIDSLPPMIDIGPGSPVGVTFGYGTRFPAKYQKALFICDWTFGTIYAIHTEPSGATYRATKEEFLSRTPLPLTDVVVGRDGALYFTIGGRGLPSELFRVTYVGNEPTAPVDYHDTRFADLRALRHRLEDLQRNVDDPAEAVALILPQLGHADRFIRYAARVALEHQDPKSWQDRVLAERDPLPLLTGCVALARQADRSLQPRVLEALDRLDFASLGEARQLDLLRVWSLVFIRMGQPDAATAARLAKKLDAYFPAQSDALNRELASLLVYLKSPTIISRLIALMKQPTTQEKGTPEELLSRNLGYGTTYAQMLANRPDAQKIHYAFVLRNLRDGWTPDERKFYFGWLQQARKWSGGASYQGFINNIDKEAFDNATDAERLALETSGARKPYQVKDLPRPQGPGHAWTLDELLALSKTGLKGRNFARGQRAFAAARCVVCHRFASDGGATGPDLTQAAGRFAFKDLCEALIEPSKVVSDQYRASVVATTSGQVYTGRIVNESKDAITMLVDPEDPTKVVEIKKSEIDESTPSKVSLMPEKLLDPLSKNEVLDLMAYLLSRGNQADPMFRGR